MSDYLRVVDALTHSDNCDYKEKIELAEKMCPLIKNYRIRAKNLALKARELNFCMMRDGILD